MNLAIEGRRAAVAGGSAGLGLAFPLAVQILDSLVVWIEHLR